MYEGSPNLHLDSQYRWKTSSYHSQNVYQLLIMASHNIVQTTLCEISPSICSAEVCIGAAALEIISSPADTKIHSQYDARPTWRNTTTSTKKLFPITRRLPLHSFLSNDCYCSASVELTLVHRAFLWGKPYWSWPKVQLATTVDVSMYLIEGQI